MRNLDKENIYFVTGYLLGYHIGAGQDEMECEDRESFKEGYDAGCADVYIIRKLKERRAEAPIPLQEPRKRN